MSRRRARPRRSQFVPGHKGEKVLLLYGYPIRKGISGRVEWLTGMFAVDAADAAAQPLYARAHTLMPKPRSSVFDPFEHAARAPAAMSVLATTDATTPEDDVLVALAILGHTPTDDALDALFAFLERRPEGDLARVARLAVAECVVLGGELGIFACPSSPSGPPVLVH